MTRPAPRPPLRRVAVFGAGQVGLLAAASLARAIPRAAIVFVGTPRTADALADTAHTTRPSLARLHARLGIDEPMLLARAAASHRIASLHSGWPGSKGDWFLGEGAAVDPTLAQLFADGHLSIAAALAAAGRFALPADDPASPLSDLDYGLRFDPGAHLRLLAALARQLRIELLEGVPVELARRDSGAVTAARLADGRTIEADLFIDATGPWRRLAGLLGDDRRIDWSAFMAIDRMVEAATPAAPALAPADLFEARPDGIRIVSPGRDSTRHFLCYASSATSDDQAAAALGTAPRDPAPLPCFRAEEAWRENVIALGDAAASLPPLGWTNLHLAAAQIELLLELLPGRDIVPVERREYNRRAALLADSVLDFAAAHLATAPPEVGPFWAAAAEARQPDTLKRRLGEFARRGRLPHMEEDTIPPDQWVQLLLGIGLPASLSPRALAMAPGAREALVKEHRRKLAAAVAGAQPYAQWLPSRIGTAP